MCGIAAIFAHSPDAPSVERGELVSIRDRMLSRGPDGAGEWISPDQRVGLAHRRLAIIDLSPTGAQPMASSDGRFVITFNGEIYNYRELRHRLEQGGCQFRSQSDTEVLLHLYAEKGADLVNDLRGMYAFAIWDARERGLFLARDPFGIKPLYYADDGRTIRVASQVKALLQSQHIDTAPEPAGHVGFFVWGSVPEPFTLYRGIRALPAGNTMRIDASGCGGPKSFCSVPEDSPWRCTMFNFQFSILNSQSRLSARRAPRYRRAPSHRRRSRGRVPLCGIGFDHARCFCEQQTSERANSNTRVRGISQHTARRGAARRNRRAHAWDSTPNHVDHAR
jgi:asparagine synthase (glutamine-hydrolysing)